MEIGKKYRLKSFPNSCGAKCVGFTPANYPILLDKSQNKEFLPLKVEHYVEVKEKEKTSLTRYARVYKSGYVNLQANKFIPYDDSGTVAWNVPVTIEYEV